MPEPEVESEAAALSWGATVAVHPEHRDPSWRPLIRRLPAQAMSPTMALIAMGVPEHHSLWTAWLYGHPNGGVVRLLANSIPRRRAMVSVQVGRSMGRFETMRLGHAIYGTGWDGNIDVTTWGDGRLQGETAHEERSESRSVADLIPRRLR